jgi:hypothetical protein
MSNVTSSTSLAAGATAYTSLGTVLQVGPNAIRVIVQTSATPPSSTAAGILIAPGPPYAAIGAASGDSIYAIAAGLATSVVSVPVANV